jgi:anaerobic magnesium-protoporphyrin IX monomethyl ester cyclase
MAEILFIIPPNNFTDMVRNQKYKKSKGYYVYYPHLGISYIASVLLKSNFKVEILDSLVNHLTEEEIIKILKKKNPKIIGITVTTPTLPVVYSLVERIKENLSSIVVVGGPHISFYPEMSFFLKADFGIAGEADYSFLQLANFLLREEGKKENIKGLIWKENSKIFQNQKEIIENLDEIPFPARELLENQKYVNPVCSEKTTSIITTRGCPFSCLFCSRAVRERNYSERSVENVIEEIKEITEKFKIKYITFMDETFTYNQERAENIAREILKNNLKIKWAAQTRVNLVSLQLLKIFKEAGCVNLSFGVESGKEEIRKILKKPISYSEYKEFVEMCKKAGIETNAYYMLGHPNETLQDIKETINFAKRLDTDYASFNITNIFPGSPLYEEMRKKNLISENIWEEFTLGRKELPVYLPEGVKRRELEKMIGVAFRSFYFRPKIIYRKFKKLKNFSDFFHHLKIAFIILKDYFFA